MKANTLQGYLLFAILGGFVAWMVWGQPKIEVDVKAYEDRINKLEMKVDSLHTKNVTLEFEADSLESKIVEYDKTIQKLNTRIYVIKKNTKKQLDAVDRFGDDELEKFFSNRYKQYKDSIN